MNKQMVAGTKNAAGGVEVEEYKKQIARVNEFRTATRLAIEAQGQFATSQMNVVSNATKFNEALAKNKIGLKQLVGNMAGVKAAYKEQIALQNMMVAGFKTDAAGRTSADVIVPKNLSPRVAGLRQELGYYNKILGSVSENTIKWGKNTQWAGRQLMAGFTMPVMGAAAAAGYMAYQVDKGLTDVVKVYGDASSKVQWSNDQIRDSAMKTSKAMAATYGQSVEDTLTIMKELAAAGETGADLQDRTAEVSRAALLGELDVQEATKASIQLQSVYGLSTKGLGDAFNYMNSMENGTVLTMQDFMTAIPKVSGIMKSLGGNIQETGILLTAFKAAGIDAAEGANALKSISFRAVASYGKGLQTFNSMTGKDLKSIIAETNGAVIPTLQKMYQAMDGLSAPNKLAVVRDVFGIYQGSKAQLLMEQLTKGSEQMARAMEISQQSTEDWAATASGEAVIKAASASNRIKQAYESLKISLAEVGKYVLKAAIPVVQFLDRMVQGFNDMGDTNKKILLIAAAFTALAGPIIMLSGLALNFIGNIGKMLSFLIGLGARFKIFNAEEKASALLAKQASFGFNQEAYSLAELSKQISRATEAQLAFNQARGVGAAPTPRVAPAYEKGANAALFPVGGPQPTQPKPTGYTQMANGRWRGPDNKFSNAASAQAAQKAAEAEARAQDQVLAARRKNSIAAAETLAYEEATTRQLQAQRARYAGIGKGIAGGVLGIGMIGSMTTDANSKLSALAESLTAVGFAASLMPGVMTKVVSKVASIGPVVSRVAPSMAAGFAAAGSAIAAIAGPVAIAGAAIGGLWYISHKASEGARKDAEAIGDSAKAWAEVYGFAYTEAGESIDAAGKKVQNFKNIQDSLAKSDPALIKYLQSLALAPDADRTQITSAQMAAALGEVIKAKVHGATVEAATNAGVTALQIMGNTLSTGELKVKIQAEMDVNDTTKVVQEALNQVGDVMSVAAKATGGSWSENLMRGMFAGGDDIRAAGAASVQTHIKAWYAGFVKLNDDERAAAFNNMATAVNADFMKVFQGIDPKALDRIGIHTYQEFVTAFQKAGNRTGFLLKLGVKDAAAAEKVADTLRAVNQGIAESAGGYSEEQAKNIYDTLVFNKALVGTQKQAMTVKQAMAAYAQTSTNARNSVDGMNEAQQLAMLNFYRMQAGLPKATNVLDGFGDSAIAAARKIGAAAAAAATAKKDFNMDDLGAIGDNASVKGLGAESLVSSYKQAFSGAMSSVYSGASDLASQAADAGLNRIEEAGKRTQDRIDADQTRIEKKFDARQQALDAKWENKSDALAKKQDKRKQLITNSYDIRIKKVQEAIDAEQRAEDIRQRIFEAEKTRIQRMSEMYSKGIDFSQALNSGNVDEAARISNDIQATQESWNVNDAATSSKSASDKRIDALGNQKDAIEKAKQTRLDALDDIDAAEKKAFDKAKKRASDRLKDEKDKALKTVAARKKAADKETANAKAAFNREQNARKAGLNAELAALQAYTPRNRKELATHIAKVEAAYRRYGVDLRGQGKAWAGIVGNSLTQSVKTSAAAMRDNIAWDKLGKVIAQKVSVGAFGMTLSDFKKWVTTGSLPSTGFNSVKPAKKDGRAGYTINSGPYAGKFLGYERSMHTGGVVGKGNSRGNHRVGFSGGQSQSEVTINALKGESVLNRKATNTLGEDFVHAVNRGQIPRGIGGPDLALPGIAGLMTMMAGTMMGAAASAAMRRAGQGAMQRDAISLDSGNYSASAGKPGRYGGSTFNADQLRNAATIVSTGKSMGASTRDLTIALMTAMQESALKNLNYGDRDSLGLFQQRSGWGTASARTNPETATRMFFQGGAQGQRGLFDFPNRGDLTLAQAAQAVQVSAFPGAYAKWQDEAQAILNSMTVTGQSFGGNGYGAVGGAYARPVGNARVTSRYGMRTNPVTGVYKLHDGMDFGVPVGTPIHAALAGTVEKAHFESGYGNYTKIASAGGLEEGYAHQSRIGVRAGQSVAKGQVIGYSGNTGNSTGPHLHFLVHKNGRPVNPQSIFPGLSSGGMTLNDGYAKLHAKEAVLTKPLTQKLQDGINNMDNSSHAQYNVRVEINGDVNKDVDVQKAVEKAMQNVERRRGLNRRIG